METAEVKLCKRGHPRTPDNVNKGGACIACRKAIRSTPEDRVLQKKWNENYTQRVKSGLPSPRRSTPSDQSRKEWQKQYRNSPERKRLMETEEYKNHKKEWWSNYRQTDKYKEDLKNRREKNKELETIARLEPIRKILEVRVWAAQVLQDRLREQNKKLRQEFDRWELYDYFTVRVNNCFLKAGITNIEELTSKSESELLAIPHMGRKSVHQIKEVLAEFNMRLELK
jgi:hypothetical protein